MTAVVIATTHSVTLRLDDEGRQVAASPRHMFTPTHITVTVADGIEVEVAGRLGSVYPGRTVPVHRVYSDAPMFAHATHIRELPEWVRDLLAEHVPALEGRLP